MKLTAQEIENLSELLLSNDEANTEIAFLFLSSLDEAIAELFTDVFCVYKLSKNEEIKRQSMDFFDKLGFDTKSSIFHSKLNFNISQDLTESYILKKISTYVIESKGLLDGVKIAIFLYKKHQVGVHYILEKASFSLQRIFLKNFIQGTSFQMKRLALNKIPDALYSFEELTSIDLSENNLAFIPSKISVFTKLQKLDLSNNGIRKLSNAISSLKHLTHLNISYNKMRDFPEELLEMKQLTHLNLVAMNRQSNLSIPDAFQELPNIRQISLCDREFKTHFIDYPLFSTLSQKTPIKLTKLSMAELAYQQNKEGVNYLLKYSQNISLIHRIIQEVLLDRNQTLRINNMILEKLPLQLTEYPIQKIYLKGLDIDKKYEEDIFQVFSSLTEVTEAIYYNNWFTEINPYMIASEKLKKLSFEYNKLTFLPKEVEKLKDLEELSLKDNCFQIFPKEILACEKLRILTLSNNQFNEFPEEIGALENLEILYLENFLKDNITEDVRIPDSYKKLKKLQHIHFSHFKYNSYSSYLKQLKELLPENCKIILGEERVKRTSAWGQSNSRFSNITWEKFDFDVE